jgi:hypothetical protein
MKNEKVKVLSTENLADNIARIVIGSNYVLEMEATLIYNNDKWYMLKANDGTLVKVPAIDCEIKTSKKPKNKKDE